MKRTKGKRKRKRTKRRRWRKRRGERFIFFSANGGWPIDEKKT